MRTINLILIYTCYVLIIIMTTITAKSGYTWQTEFLTLPVNIFTVTILIMSIAQVRTSIFVYDTTKKVVNKQLVGIVLGFLPTRKTYRLDWPLHIVIITIGVLPVVIIFLLAIFSGFQGQLLLLIWGTVFYITPFTLAIIKRKL